MTRRSVAASMLRCCIGERLLSKMMSGALLAVASARISSSLPRPTSVAGSADSRTWKTVPAITAPALRASSMSSSSDSRPCSPMGMPGKRGARFQPSPTSKARSAIEVETGCEVFVTKSVLKPSCGGSHEREGFNHLRHYTRSASRRRPCQTLLVEPVACFVLHAGFVTETRDPMNAGIFAEPGELAFRVLPRGLLNCGARVFEFFLSALDFAQLAVADEVKGLGVLRQTAVHQTRYFFHPAVR